MKRVLFLFSLFSLWTLSSCTHSGSSGGNSTATKSERGVSSEVDSLPAWKGIRLLGVAGKRTLGKGIASDSSGNVYVTGYTEGGLDGNKISGAESEDSFVTKYNSSGEKQWTRQVGLAGRGILGLGTRTRGNSITTDPSGNVYVTGNTQGRLDGKMESGGAFYVFVTKYNSSGEKQWTRLEGNGEGFIEGYGITSDSSGNVYVTGYTSFGIDGNKVNGSQDCFVMKFDPSGAKKWAKLVGVARKSTTGNGIATDSFGNIFVTGDTDGDLDGNTLSRPGAIDFFIIKLNFSGEKLWTKQMGVGGEFTYTYGKGITPDSSGNIYVTGSTGGGLDGNTSTGGVDFFLTKFSPAGEKLWTKQMGVQNGDTDGKGITSDSSDNIYVAGSMDDISDLERLDFKSNLFLTKYNSSGEMLWTREVSLADGSIGGFGITSDSFGNFYVTGHITGGLDGNKLTGVMDFFVTKFNSSGDKQ